MSFPRYPEYKDSGVEWLGQVPAHWAVAPVKRVFASLDGKRVPLSAEERGGRKGEYPYYGASGVIDFVDEYIFDEDLVLVSEDGANLLNRSTPIAFVATGKYWVNNHAHILRPLDRHAVFWAEAIERTDLEPIVTGAAQPKLTAEALGGLRLAFPPDEEERRAIADFVQRESSRLDALAAEQQRLVELLNEKRQAVISHAVTKGLDPGAPTKESGVAWLGQIPTHWDVGRARRMFKVRSEPAHASDQQLTASQKHGVMFQSDFVEREGRRVVEVLKLKDSLLHVEPNDFIISMRSFQGGIEWCGLRGSTSYHYVMLTPVKNVHPPFFAHLFKSAVYIQALRATTDLIRDGQELRWSHFVQVDLPLVPLPEQVAIAAHLDAELGKFDPLIAEAERATELLQERRTALVSAAVTGQIDVRNSSVAPPQVGDTALAG